LQGLQKLKALNFIINSTSTTSVPTVDDAAVQRAVEEVAAAVAHQETEPQNSNARVHDFGHGEAVRKETLTKNSIICFL
jgi:hypothetical protein